MLGKTHFIHLELLRHVGQLGRCDKLLSPLDRLAPNFQEVAETKMRDERLERRKWVERMKQKNVKRVLIIELLLGI